MFESTLVRKIRAFNVDESDYRCQHFTQASSVQVTVWLCIFWHKNIGAKAARKMLMKLTTGWEPLNTEF